MLSWRHRVESVRSVVEELVRDSSSLITTTLRESPVASYVPDAIANYFRQRRTVRTFYGRQPTTLNVRQHTAILLREIGQSTRETDEDNRKEPAE